MVNLLFGGVITYRTYSSQGIRMSTKFLIESSPKNTLKFRWQFFYIFKSYKLDRYLSVTSVVKFWEVNSKYIFAQISVLEKQLFDLTFTDFQINGQNVPKSEFQNQISSESVWFFFIYIYHFFRFSFVTEIFERLKWCPIFQYTFVSQKKSNLKKISKMIFDQKSNPSCPLPSKLHNWGQENGPSILRQQRTG